MKLFFIHPNKNICSRRLFKFDTVPVSKLKWDGDLLLILCVINFSRFSSQWFRRARQDVGEHSRSQHNLQQSNPNNKICSRRLFKFDAVPVSKLKWDCDLLLILCVINFSRFSSQWFRRARQDVGDHSRSQHNLQQIEQIDLRLYNNKDTQELGSKYTNEQQLLHKLCFFKTGLLPVH